MGAQTFEILSVGRFKTASEAYSHECAEAEYYSGHDPYNGTISTTDGCYRRTGFPRYGTRKFDGWIGKEIDEMDKRDCRFIELEGAALKKVKEKHGYKGKKGIKAFYFYGWAAC
jgi:hypothetical protein